MTQENKELLFKDLSARLPYEVKVHAKYVDTDTDVEKVGVLSMIDNDTVVAFTCDDTNCYNYVAIHEVKPYLFPISSMNEEQKREYNYWKHEVPVGYYEYGDIVEKIELFDSPESFQYLIENHFDYHGLIEKGLAIDATGKNIY